MSTMQDARVAGAFPDSNLADGMPSESAWKEQLTSRKRRGGAFRSLGILSILIALGVLAVLIADVLVRGLPWLDLGFISNFDSRFADRAGLWAGLVGSVWMIGLTILFALPIGVMAAIYLEEYAGVNSITSFIRINITNLAGIPSIIYGLLGLQIFVRYLGLGRSVLAGALTMALLVLPIVIVASQEAIRAVPPSLRQASFALGATKWQTVWHHVLPAAFPGILTGNILAASRAIGETAPLITIGALTYLRYVPDDPLDLFTVLPIQIFNWISKPQDEFHDLAAAGIIVLLAVLLSLNGLAIFLRQRLRRRLRW